MTRTLGIARIVVGLICNRIANRFRTVPHWTVYADYEGRGESRLWHAACCRICRLCMHSTSHTDIVLFQVEHDHSLRAEARADALKEWQS